MKRFLIISLAVVPMLAGCAGALGPEVSPEVSETRRQSRSIADLRHKLDRLSGRVRKLDRRVSERSDRPATVVAGSNGADFSDIKARIADLEAAMRRQANAGSSPSAPEKMRNASEVAKELAAINQKLVELAVAHNATEVAQGKLKQSQSVVSKS